MDALYVAGTFAFLAGCVYLGWRAGVRLGSADFAEAFIIGFVVAAGWVTVGGYCLSSLHLLARPWAWLVWMSVGCAIAGRPSAAPGSPERRGRWYRLIRGRGFLLLTLLLLSWVAAANLIILVGSAPNSFDAMLYHLTRVGYYLQNGTLAPYGANFFAQEELGKNSSILEIGLFAVGGKSDILQGLPQFIAWFAAGAAVYRLSRNFGARASAAAFAGMAEMLLSIAWLQATTAQNDLLIAAELACSFYFLRRYLRSREAAFLVLTGVALGLAIGTKASALVALPAMAIAAGPRAWRWKQAGVVLLASLPFVLPAGCLDNLRLYGNPLGRSTYEISVYHDRSLKFLAESSGRNFLRFSLDAFSLEQLPADPIFAPMLARAQAGTIRMLAKRGIDLARTDDTRWGFFADRLHRPDENLSYFGPFGLLCLAGTIAACFRREIRWLGAGFLAFCLLQCVAGPYDFTRGRLFFSGAAIVLPAAAVWIGGWGRSGRRWAMLFVLIAAAEIAPAAIFRNNCFFFPKDGRPAFWQEDRIQQMTGYHPSYPAQRAFADRVPAGARVGVAIDGYEYPLFGPRLGRHLVPVLARFNANQPLPADLDWLLFGNSGASRPGDVALGAGWFLRRLKP